MTLTIRVGEPSLFYINAKDFKVIGYNSTDHTNLYVIDFHDVEFTGSGPRIAVEIDIETG